MNSTQRENYTSQTTEYTVNTHCNILSVTVQYSNKYINSASSDISNILICYTIAVS